MVEQLIADSMKKYIRDQIESENRCSFRFFWPDGYRCHFLTNPECGFYSRRQDIKEIPERREFYRCKL